MPRLRVFRRQGFIRTCAVIARYLGLTVALWLSNSVTRAQADAWTSNDVGAGGLPGSSAYDAATDAFVVKAAGVDINGVRDGFRFVHQSANGNVQIIAQVEGFAATHPWAKAGVMIRQGIADNAPFVAVVLTEKYGVQFVTRTSAGDSAQQTPPSPPWSDAPASIWLKLVRTGNTFRAYRSANSIDWVQVGLATVALPTTTEVGIALTSHDTGAYATARFNSVRVKTPAFGAALLITGATSLNGSEQTIKARLENIGYAVKTKRSADVTATDTTDKSVVLVSDTASTLPPSFSGIPTPIVTWSWTSCGALGLTGTTVDDAGLTEKSEEGIVVVQPDHPLAAGFTGNVKVALPGSMSWGRPTAAAVVVATGKRRSTEDDPVLLAYESGAATFKGPAPARRAGIFLTSDLIGDLLDNGWQLFEAAIAWAANIPPTVSVTAPPFGSVVLQGTPVPLQATAADSDGRIVRVEFWVDATKIGEATQPPYSAMWANPMSGVYSITAVAIDNRNGRTTSDPVAIIVNAPPTVALTAPLDGAVFQQADPIQLAATAQDSDGTIKKVAFFDGTRPLGELTLLPYSLTWGNAALGSHTLRATAFDNYDASATSPAIHIFVNAPPSVALMSPTEGTVVALGQPTTLSAAASDSDGTIATVEFFVDDISVGKVSAAPYQVSWTSQTSGAHAIKAKATDNNNGNTTSATVHIVVNAPPAVTLTSPSDGTTFSVIEPIGLAADANDTDGQVTSVEFQADGKTIATLSTAPFTYTWTGAPAGSHTLTAKATDNLGATATSVARIVSVVTDKDGDGLPDVWEMAHFGSLSAGPNDDPDQDGLTNLREYQTGRDPNVYDADAIVLIPSEIVLWLRADRGLANTDGTPVANWPDQSGNNNDATGNVAEQQPVFVGNQVNGLPVVRFDGVSNNLGVDLHSLAGSDYTIVGVTARRSARAPAYFIGGGGATSELGLGYGSETSFSLHYTGGTTAGATAVYTQPTFALFEADAGTASGHRLWKNGKAVGSDANTTPLGATNLAYVGSDGASPFEGDIAEVIVYRRKLDDSVRTAIEKYLLAKYGIKVGGDPKPGDSDGDGLLDAWEMKCFGNLDHDGDEDFDGDGLTNRQEMDQGTDPTDYYNGDAPTVTIVSGDGQSGVPGEYLVQPLTVNVFNSSGQLLANAPVAFAVQNGAGGLAAAFAQPTTSTSVARTDASGTAKAFFKILSADENATTVVEASATSSVRTSRVLFTEHAPSWFPDSDKVVVELNAGETATRGITLTNPTTSKVSYSFVPTSADAAVDYTVSFSDQAGGPAYQWNDIRTTGTWLKSLTLLRDGYEAVDLSFAFPYYGQSFTRMYVGIDGYLTFGHGAISDGAGDVFPSAFNPGNCVAPFFDSFASADGGEVYVQDFGDRVVIQWDAMIDWRRLPDTFQAILYQNGDIVFQYKSLKGSIDDGVVGMQNADGAQGVSIQEWDNVVKDNYAVLIAPRARWLSITPASGSLEPNQRAGIGLAFDATHLAGGVYQGTIALQSDYPGKASVPISATLVVNAPPTVAISQPARTKRVLLGQAVSITATAADPDGAVAKIELYDGTTKIGESTQSPYTVSWTSSQIGQHLITAQATDLKGAIGKSLPQTVYIDTDSDGDGIGDEWEMYYFNRLTYMGTGDVDGDGISDRMVYELGLSPYSTDEDNDGLSNKFELDHGLDPFTPESGDDHDNDGFPTIFERIKGSDASSAASIPTPDYIVDPGGGGTHTNLKDALTAAGSAFKIVQVKPGVYKGPNNTGLTLDNVMLISSGGAASTIIDGETVNGGITLRHGAVLHGLTIQNCSGSGVTLSGSGTQRIDCCVITGCVGTNGGGIYANSDDVIVRHCTIVGNHSYDRNHVPIGSGLRMGYGRVQLENCIVWNDAASDIDPGAGILLTSHCDLRGPFDGEGNMSVDPLLTPDGHLQALSPLRGRGLAVAGALKDMENEPWPGSAVDIGADQFVDADNDSLPDAWEQRFFGSLAPIAKGDPDGDGLSNLLEYVSGTNPTIDGDADNDGLSDAYEILVSHSDPLKADTDGDGMPDKYEVDNGLAVNAADDLEDADGDGYPNIYEYRANSRPNDSTSVPPADFTVEPSGAGGALSTIQAAINATTRDYQVIKVKPGVYKQSVNVFRWRTLIVSTDGAASTIVDGDGIRGNVSLSADAVFVGFTVRNGSTDRGTLGNGLTMSNGSFGYHAKSLVQDCVFINNRSMVGGAVQVYSNGAFEGYFRHCTFLNNRADQHGAGIMVAGGTPGGAGATITDCIFWDLSPDEIFNYQSRVTVRNSIVRGGYAGTNVRSVDPRLTISGHLAVDSPARNCAITPSYRDMDGELRSLGGTPDLGADEFIDADGDGLADWWELKNFGSLTAQSGADDPDGDGLSNAVEYAAETNPNQAVDSDGDGIPDAVEIGVYHTNPNSADTDGDGIPDGLEIQNGLDPLRDDAMEDADGDGYPNIFEVMRGSNPLSAASVPKADYTVALSGPATHTSIVAACSAASNSGQNFRIVLVSPGTYPVVRQSVTLANQRILLISSGGAAQTVIDGTNVSYPLQGVLLATRSAIHGFTIRGMRDGRAAVYVVVDARISNCVIRNNSSSQGAAVSVPGDHASIVNCTIVNNTATTSGSGLALNQYAVVEVVNSIMWDPGPATEFKGTGTVAVRNSIIRDANRVGGGIDLDPLVTTDGHLRFMSPARNAGAIGVAPNLDMDGEARPIGTAPDIGADQFSGLGTADADEDGMLDTWEVAHGLNPAKADAYDDNDNDGVPNIYEYAHGTDPRDPTSVPAADIVVDGAPGAADPAHGVYATLPEAIAALTKPNEIIEVRPGTYAGGVSIAGTNARGVWIRSAAGAVTTSIDGAGATFGINVSTDATITGFTFAHCTGGVGAGLYVDTANVRVTNCVFRNNAATDGQGGAIYGNACLLQVTHCTLFNNTSAAGVGAGIGAAGGAVQVANSIVWNSAATVTGGTELEGSPSTSIALHASLTHGTGHFTDAGGNLSLDPHLSPAFGHIGAGSPAIDAGDPAVSVATDFEGDARPNGARCDIGADEFADSDGDGLNDGWERAMFGDLSHTAAADDDGDGLTNIEEFEAGTHPQKADTDGDGLTDGQEVRTYRTNPLSTDTDGDGIADNVEVAKGLDPLRDDTYADSDGDGIPNLKELELGTDPQNPDTDGDGLNDGMELALGLNPLVKDYVGPDQTPPPAPSGLQVVEVTPNSVKLSWTAVTDPSAPVQYEVWRNGLLVGRTSDTTLVDDYGDPGVYAYSYYVVALDAEGNVSAHSETISGSTAAGFHPLPGDSDGDGIPDELDASPNDPANAFADDDGDGIPNRDDADPQIYDGPPPYVKILNNDDKVDYVKGESMTLTVRVSDPRAKVTIYANGTRKGEATWIADDIYQYEWSNMPVGVYHVMAIATDSKKAKLATKTFLIDVAELEAHITFVGPHPFESFGRNYSIHTHLDGEEVDRPILRNTLDKVTYRPKDPNQPIDVHYERFYRGGPVVTIYAGGKPYRSFKIPAGERYPLVVLREFRNDSGGFVDMQPYVIDPSVPAKGQPLVKVANFSGLPIFGGFTRYFFYVGVGGPNFNDPNQRAAGLIDAVKSGMYAPARVEPGRIADLGVELYQRGYVSFEALGDYMISWRALPDPSYNDVPDFPKDISTQWYTPLWWQWYRKYGDMVYQYVSLTPAELGPGGRVLYCYFRPSLTERGLRWSGGIPILPEIRVTPYNVGSVFYPGGRGHPANNTKPFNIPLTVNDDYDDNKPQPDNADTFIGSNDDDIVTVNIQVDLRDRTDPTKIRIKLPTDSSGAPVVRGYYGNNLFLRTPLSGTETVMSLAEHPDFLFDGLKFYFEGLKPQLDARIEVDLLDKNDVPVNRIFPTEGSPETLRIDVLPRVRLAADQNRDGKIDASDVTTIASPFRFWINDDDDYGDTEGKDIPGQKGVPGITRRNDDGADWASGPAFNADFPQRGQVDGVRDLTDFFPIHLDVKPLLDLLPPSGGYRYTLKQMDGALNIVYTSLKPDAATSYQTQALTTGFGNLDVNGSLDSAPGDAITWQVTADGIDVPLSFLQSISANDTGIILAEARAATTRPLRLVITKDGDTITEVQLPLSISPVEGMFRHLNLSNVAGEPTDLNAPSRSRAPNWPDELTNGKNFVFLHGYNVNQQQARGWATEVYKKMWWSGSNAKFYAVTWRGAESQAFGKLTANYHINVVHAFQTAPALAGFINHLDGEVTVAAHSLGNMVVFAALNLPPNADPTKGPAKVARHFALDAALAVEALDGSSPFQSEMSNSLWQEGTWHINERLWASEWFKLFPNDSRGKLTWRDIFPNTPTGFAPPTIYNFFSSGEEVLDYRVARPTPTFPSADLVADILTPVGDNAWYYQETLKGQTGNDFILGSDYGGWGFGKAYCNPRLTWSGTDWITVYDPPTQDQINAMTWDDTKRQTRPLFLWGTSKLITSQLNHQPDEPVSDLYGPTGSAFAARNLYKLLADTIPARTFAVGKVPIPKLGGLNDKNFNLSFPPFQDGWPAERLASTYKGQRWLHSDGREVAYKYNHGLFDKWVSLGQLK